MKLVEEFKKPENHKSFAWGVGSIAAGGLVMKFAASAGLGDIGQVLLGCAAVIGVTELSKKKLGHERRPMWDIAGFAAGFALWAMVGGYSGMNATQPMDDSFEDDSTVQMVKPLPGPR